MYNLIDLPKISRSGFGDLTFIEGQNHIPFEIKRVYYIYIILEIVSSEVAMHIGLFSR